VRHEPAPDRSGEWARDWTPVADPRSMIGNGQEREIVFTLGAATADEAHSLAHDFGDLRRRRGRSKSVGLLESGLSATVKRRDTRHPQSTFS